MMAWKFRLGITILLLGGCSVRNDSGVQAQGSQAPALAPDVDHARAFQPVTKIEPLVTPPQRPPTVTPLSERGSKQIAAATRLIGEQRYTEASLELERALRFDSNHFEIHRALALLHWQAGNIERAKTHAQKTIDANPDCAAAHYILGRCHAIAGNKAAALTAFRTAILCSDLDDDPETAALCHYHLAQAFVAEGYLEAALAEFAAYERVAAQLGAATARLELAALLRSTGGKAGEERSLALEKLGRFGEAADAMAPSVGAGPTNVERGKRYARLLAQAGRFDDALNAARAVPADDSEFVAFLFDLHQRAGHPERIVEDLRARVAAKPDDAEMLAHLADALERLKRNDEARAELAAFLDRQPDAHPVRLRLLGLLMSDGQAAEAVRQAGIGIRRNPDRAAEWQAKIAGLAADRRQAEAALAVPPKQTADAAEAYLRGVIARAAGRNELADEFLTRSLELEPTFAPARVALAEARLRENRFQEAIKAAARLDPDRPEDPRLERVLGRAYDHLDDVEKAVMHFRAATQLDRSDVESMYALAQLYRRTDKILQAQQQLRHLLEKDPDHEAGRELLALLYFKEGKADVGLHEVEELRRRSKSATTVARCRTLLEPELRRDAAARRQVLMDAMNQAGPDVATWVAIAETYEETEAQAAHEAYLKALQLDPQSEEALLGAIGSSFALLELGETVQRREELLRLRPNRDEWRLKLIDLYAVVQDYDAALRLARESEARPELPAPRRRVYRVAIVQVLAEAGRDDEVIAQLKEYVEDEPEDQEWRSRLADAFFNAKRYGEAVLLYEELMKSDGKERVARGDLIEALASADRYERAAQYLLDWLGDDPESDDLISILIRLLAHQKRYDDAFELAHARLPRTGNRELFQDLLISRLGLAKRYNEAIELTEALIEEVITVLRSLPEGGRRRGQERPHEERAILRPNEPATPEALQGRLQDLRIQLAGQLILAKEYRDAEQNLTTWLDAEKDTRARARFLLALADCQRSQSNEEAATTTLERALVLIPTNPTLNNDIAYHWIDRGERLDEAEKLIRYAVAQLPRQAAYLDTYGWLLYKKGEFAGARTWLLRANHARDGKDPVIHDHLGDTMWRLGERGPAVEHWRLALERTNEREEDARISEDERRVRTVTPGKIEDAGAGRSPAVAPLGGELHPAAPRSGSQ